MMLMINNNDNKEIEIIKNEAKREKKKKKKKTLNIALVTVRNYWRVQCIQSLSLRMEVGEAEFLNGCKF